MLPINSLSIAMYGEGRTRGNVSIIKSAMTTNQACCNVIIDKNKADYKYVYYYLKTQYNQLRSLSSGVRKNLNSNDIKEFEINIPESISTQQRIASVLSSLDDKIELNNKINAELEAMAKAVYDYWFVQFDFPDENGKPYKSAGGNMVYNSEVKRNIPHGWEVKTIDYFIRTDKNGDWGKEENEGNYNLKVQCIRGTDINGLNGNGEAKCPTRFILEKNKSKLLEPYDVVIEISGGSPTQSTGRLSYITEELLQRFNNSLICSNFCKAISLNKTSSFYYFIHTWNRLYSNNILFGFEGKTSGIKNLLFETFTSNYKVVVPNENLQINFFDIVSSLEKQKQINLKQNQTLSSLRDWLLPMLMNGQVTVNEAYTMANQTVQMAAEPESGYGK